MMIVLLVSDPFCNSEGELQLVGDLILHITGRTILAYYGDGDGRGIPASCVRPPRRAPHKPRCDCLLAPTNVQHIF